MMSLFCEFTLDFKHKSRVGRNIWRSAVLSVRELGRNGQAPLTANFNAEDAEVPALDHLTLTQLELERGAGETRVKLFVICLKAT